MSVVEINPLKRENSIFWRRDNVLLLVLQLAPRKSMFMHMLSVATCEKHNLYSQLLTHMQLRTTPNNSQACDVISGGGTVFLWFICTIPHFLISCHCCAVPSVVNEGKIVGGGGWEIDSGVVKDEGERGRGAEEAARERREKKVAAS